MKPINPDIVLKPVKEYVLMAVGMLMYSFGWIGCILPAGGVGGGAAGLSLVLCNALSTAGIDLQIGTMVFIINAVLLLVAGFIVGWNFGLKTIFCVVIINKYRTVSYGKILIYSDFVIIGSALLVGMGISAVIYGYVMTAVVGYTVDMIMAGNQQSSQVFIVTHDYEKMAQAIVDNVHRGVTLIDSQGWYSKKESKIVMVVCRKRETSMILKFVKTIDPEAFMTVGSVMGVYGKGFQTIGKG